ncbi:hypothetical protein TNCV_1099971 [Trichonephila clavipes]|nr:hypothetical protein TNCV_1099971 [Trichonephila clavipes]
MEIREDEIRMCIECLRTTTDREIGGMQKWYIGKMIEGIVIEVITRMALRGIRGTKDSRAGIDVGHVAGEERISPTQGISQAQTLEGIYWIIVLKKIRFRLESFSSVRQATSIVTRWETVMTIMTYRHTDRGQTKDNDPEATCTVSNPRARATCSNIPNLTCINGCGSY